MMELDKYVWSKNGRDSNWTKNTNTGFCSIYYWYHSLLPSTPQNKLWKKHRKNKLKIKCIVEWINQSVMAMSIYYDMYCVELKAIHSPVFDSERQTTVSKFRYENLFGLWSSLWACLPASLHASMEAHTGVSLILWKPFRSNRTPFLCNLYWLICGKRVVLVSQ